MASSKPPSDSIERMSNDERKQSLMTRGLKRNLDEIIIYALCLCYDLFIPYPIQVHGDINPCCGKINIYNRDTVQKPFAE
ncbi:hypothetical protein THAOC_04434, partial [Thalassiosira oceanica]